MPKTVDEISRETGFSVTTVRLVINGQSEKYRISGKTRRIIEDYVTLHGYSFNHAARSLKLNRSDTVGFVAPDLSNAFFAHLMAVLEALCRARNLLLLTVASHEDPILENRAVASLLARGVDGLVIAPCQAEIQPLLAKNRGRTSIVMIDRDFASGLFPTVVSDNFSGGLAMTRGMLRESRGKTFPFLCGHAKLPSIRDRIRGFSEACREMAEGGDGRILQEMDDSIEAGSRMMRQLIDQAGGIPPHAFMCSSLLILEGALQQIKTQIGRIDPSILIGTFDDHTMLDLLPNPVFSIRQNEKALTSKIFEYLIGPRAEGKKTVCASSVIAAELVCRNLESQGFFASTRQKAAVEKT
ncbi:MAG: LacI family DNA-binding transcriptional regulator [Candidatus Accumulibacter sp.]|jgi:LacI family fructose operon transcriptional repressor|nr:LacI family DNA-binding transcriptional regulator [Accumulibacter sp.]